MHLRLRSIDGDLSCIAPVLPPRQDTVQRLGEVYFLIVFAI